MKRYLAILACVAFFYGTAFAQLSGPQDLSNIDSGPQVRIAGPKTTLPASTDQKANASIPDARASLAMTSAEYPVTPGDSYSLSFINSTGIVTLPIIVDLETQVNLSNLGKIEAHGMLFATLRKIVEKKVLDAYQFSAPRLIILSCGLFPVYLQGEVKQSSTLYLWGLSRLSELWTGVTPYASSRDVNLKAKDGSVRSYDLFKAWRLGDLSQDPCLRPYDTVIFKKYSRSVSIAGEIKRADTYQLTPGEGLKDLINFYGDGLTVNADPARVRIDRRETGSEFANMVIFADSSQANSQFELKDQDTVTVQGRLQTDHSVRTIVLSGEVRRPGTYTMRPGEEMADLLDKYGDGYTVNGDPARIRIDRRATGTELANAVLFFDASAANAGFELKDQDAVTVMQRLQTDHSLRTVAVNGEVRRPGTYSLRPDENLAALLRDYADGITDKGNARKVIIARLKSEKHPRGELLNIDATSVGDMALENLDTINVSSKLDWLPSVYFEGAIGSTAAVGGGTATGPELSGISGSNRVNYPFFDGELLSNAVFSLKKSFTLVSDLKNAYIVRASSGARVPVDLARFVTEHDLTGDMLLENNDYIIIPFRQYFISVGGAVMIPGRYPYVPDRTWKYYVNLAGGINTDLNNFNILTITDISDKTRSKDAMLQPEDKIFVPANSFLHFFTQISGILTVATSALTIFLTIKSLGL